MAEKHTTISLKNATGFMDWGYKTREQMISYYRKSALLKKEEAETILAASDSDFVVEQHTGVHVRKNIKII